MSPSAMLKPRRQEARHAGTSKELLIRMKRLTLFVPLLAAVSIIPAAAQGTSSSSTQRPAATATATPAKVAVIAFQAAVTQTNEFQRAFGDLQKKYDPRRQQIKALSDEIDTLTKQLQADDAKLTDDEKVARSRAIDEKKRQLDRDTQDAQSDFQSDMQDLMNRVAGKVGAVMTDYAEKHGFTLVLDASDQQSPTVLYAVDTTNITKQIIDAYNEKSGIPPPPAQGANQPSSGPAVDAPQPQAAPTH
ncbi:Outer membrane protein [Candidatus Sulfotelmatomonas gaucii]|uniref:Outer membrane protein n=1 Tax=Candidatus Sulfuritelmatomonas gaucii TaxID=2043161 RepID=A0A2N9M5X3_9BACT|nr:Outer membrane protein [Candidatus Sulfotelmatomonas gaucii]